jgi:hypothetical protein
MLKTTDLVHLEDINFRVPTRGEGRKFRNSSLVTLSRFSILRSEFSQLKGLVWSLSNTLCLMARQEMKENLAGTQSFRERHIVSVIWTLNGFWNMKKAEMG